MFYERLKEGKEFAGIGVGETYELSERMASFLRQKMSLMKLSTENRQRNYCSNRAVASGDIKKLLRRIVNGRDLQSVMMVWEYCQRMRSQI